MSIEHRSLRSLEWERLTTYLAEQNETAEGARRSLQLVPSLGFAFNLDTEIASAQILLDQTEEACAKKSWYYREVFLKLGLKNIPYRKNEFLSGPLERERYQHGP